MAGRTMNRGKEDSWSQDITMAAGGGHKDDVERAGTVLTPQQRRRSSSAARVGAAARGLLRGSRGESCRTTTSA